MGQRWLFRVTFAKVFMVGPDPYFLDRLGVFVLVRSFMRHIWDALASFTWHRFMRNVLLLSHKCYERGIEVDLKRNVCVCALEKSELDLFWCDFAKMDAADTDLANGCRFCRLPSFAKNVEPFSSPNIVFWDIFEAVPICTVVNAPRCSAM